MTKEDSLVIFSIHDEFQKIVGDVKDVRAVREMFEVKGSKTKRTVQVAFMQGGMARLEIRSDATEGKMKAMILHDGNNSWLLLPIIGKRRVKEEDFLLQPLRWVPWALVDERARVEGNENVNGRDCWLLRLGRRTGYAHLHLWIDKENFSAIRGRAVDYSGDTLSWRHEDYRSVFKNYTFPFQTDTYRNGEHISIAKILEMDVNPGLDSELFNLSTAKLK